jgi:hypothetical protein
MPRFLFPEAEELNPLLRVKRKVTKALKAQYQGVESTIGQEANLEEKFNRMLQQKYILYIIYIYSIYMKGNTWTNFVKSFAKENSLDYMKAMKHPDLSVSYKTYKKDIKTKAKQENFDYIKSTAIEMADRTKDTDNIQLQPDEDISDS